MNDKTVNNDDRVSFILYKSYADQLYLLNDEQAGKLIKGIYAYACTEIMPECDDLAIKIMLLSICNQLDIDAKKYAEKLEHRREAGRKGGLQRARNYVEASKTKNAKANQADKEEEKEIDKEKQKEIENEIEIEEETEKEKEEVEENDHDHDKENELEKEVEKKSETEHNNMLGGDGGEALADDAKIIFFTANQYPTTQPEVDKFQTLAQELFMRYNSKQPGPYDIERVFECVYSRIERSDGTYIAGYDEQKAELLRYAFEIALKAGKVNWNYISGIYNNFEKRGIKTVVDANLYEWQRKHGKPKIGLCL